MRNRALAESILRRTNHTKGPVTTILQRYVQFLPLPSSQREFEWICSFDNSDADDHRQLAAMYQENQDARTSIVLREVTICGEGIPEIRVGIS